MARLIRFPNIALTSLLLALAPAAVAWAHQNQDPNSCGPDACQATHRTCVDQARQDLRSCAAACDAHDWTCHRSCTADYHSAVTSCNEDQFGCRLTSNPNLDPTCAGNCFDSFQMCRGDLATCEGTCQDQLDAAIADCRQNADSSKRMDAFACVRAAYAASRDCTKACHSQNDCRGEIQACLPGCEVTPSPSTGTGTGG